MSACFLFFSATGQANPRVVSEAISLFEIVHRGGLVMWPILLCSVIAAGVFLERMLFYRKEECNVDSFLAGLGNLLRKGRYEEALLRCQETPARAADIARQIILRRDYPPTELREMTRETAQLALPPLEAHLPILATISYVTPLLGLLGTVTGMIEAFLAMNRASGSVSLSDLASGIWAALVSAAAGIAVAIPTSIAYNYLLTRLTAIVQDIDRVSIEVLHALADSKRLNRATPYPDEIAASLSAASRNA
ncbi:MotA/TolQ/ExbB proton channel family protein [Methylacidimicrobium sp. AP8]|uniref:MotA/TolQ/ExbB proton channel family protein n=1 Tax=Methylacidimicrobium sp. AP8 TaxID=2730359 RepID=UPI0018BFC668|nr:MotA/TolQ/ExbB proton channel family protein [Methylacidimicrobium sp. AP8]CAB4244510.1 MotA/TolQ/ExbB proton channel family protein [Methylacidimicrobium sp. AP8]